VEEYGTLAEERSHCDYSFHLILTNPTKKIVEEELPIVVKNGIASVKLYMTYNPMTLGDRDVLNITVATRKLGMTTKIHAENSDTIALYESL
jgi:dihydropyrimidinase